MSSSYVGLYVQRHRNGQIFNVQVKDSAGGSYAIPLETYIQRNAKPPINSLPDIDKYFAERPHAPEIKINHDDWDKYVGKEITIKIGNEIIKGVVEGLDDSVVAVSAEEVVRPWKLKTSEGFFCFTPEAREVRVLEA